MTIRSPWRRVFAAVFAPWLAIVMAEPAALHTCAMHAGHSAHTVSTSHATAAGHVGHEMGVPASDHAPQEDPGHAARHCTCLGGCCAASPVAPPSAPELAWVPAGLRHDHSPIADELRPALSAEHVLPFANGPPARA